MTDVHVPAVRSRNMAAIRSKDTEGEISLRTALWAQGFRYRKHRKDLPGKPDLTFRKWNAVIFVHGCFFHGHRCPDYKWPTNNAAWWRQKIESNMARDTRQIAALRASGWRVAVVWTCALTRGAPCPRSVVEQVAAWLMHGDGRLTIPAP